MKLFLKYICAKLRESWKTDKTSWGVAGWACASFTFLVILLASLGSNSVILMHASLILMLASVFSLPAWIAVASVIDDYRVWKRRNVD